MYTLNASDTAQPIKGVYKSSTINASSIYITLPEECKTFHYAWLDLMNSYITNEKQYYPIQYYAGPSSWTSCRLDKTGNKVDIYTSGNWNNYLILLYIKMCN